jgi:acetyl esterase/lipase
MARWNEWLADLGYVVFDVDYRLAPPPRWRDAPGDVQAAVAWVRARAPQLGVDPERVALLGWSAGGHLALLAAYDSPSACPPVAAVVALYPVTDLTLTNRPWPRWSIGANGDVAQFLGAPAATVPERAAAASPLSHATADGPATFLVHGRRDQLVPVEHSRRLAGELSAAGADHEYLELPGANHAYDLSWVAWSTQITRALIAAFLERALR